MLTAGRKRRNQAARVSGYLTPQVEELPLTLPPGITDTV